MFLPGESHGWRSLVGYSPWGRKESDTTERLHSLHSLIFLLSVCQYQSMYDVDKEVKFIQSMLCSNIGTNKASVPGSSRWKPVNDIWLFKENNTPCSEILLTRFPSHYCFSWWTVNCKFPIIIIWSVEFCCDASPWKQTSMACYYSFFFFFNWRIIAL